MQNIQSQRGFTLVELSISIVIMGLLVGGALAASSWVNNERVVATVSQVQSYTNAVNLFRRYYNATPGDLYRAGLRLPGCPGVNGKACNPVEAPLPNFPWYDAVGNPTATTGDGKVGNPNWNLAYGAPATTTTGGLTGAAGVDDERYLFWAHLLLAGMISGVKQDGLFTAVPLRLDITNPSTATGGGFIVGYSVPAISPFLTPKGPGSIQETVPNSGVSGMVIVQVLDPKLPLAQAAGKLPLTPDRAARIDRKADDGLPGTGFIQAYGVGASCFASIPALSSARVYDERLRSADCGLIYRIAK